MLFLIVNHIFYFVLLRFYFDVFKNSGLCTQHANQSISCLCLPGYTGRLCEQMINLCLVNGRNPCSNGGTCVPSVNGFSCICPSTHYGNTCEITRYACDNKYLFQNIFIRKIHVISNYISYKDHA
jgi:hypothetical protein